MTDPQTKLHKWPFYSLINAQLTLLAKKWVQLMIETGREIEEENKRKIERKNVRISY